MRIILSRKGFDSEFGAMSSPIMPDGTLLSFPIPAKIGNVKFSDLIYEGKTYYEIIKELKEKTKIEKDHNCHLDPDIRREVMKRGKEWTPLFGQADGAQTHLKKMGIKEGDLFLFFGSFREVELVKDKYQFKKDSSIQHIIFGYLQIGSIYSDVSNLPVEFNYHPHTQKIFLEEKQNINSCIYKASKHLSLLNDYGGSGCFNFNQSLVLTKCGYKQKSRWDLPSFFKKVNISRHSKESFKADYFQSVAKGQEIVIEENDLVTEWAKNIIKKGTNS